LCTVVVALPQLQRKQTDYLSLKPEMIIEQQ
jgi:hypothetical protein